MIKIKSATFDDLKNIAEIHTTSWKETYVGQVPQDYLDSLNISDRQRRWEQIFQGKTAEDKNLDIAYLNNKPVGFISFGKGRDTGHLDKGEIFAVYLLKESLEQSVGYNLFLSAKRKLIEIGFLKSYLWVLDTNAHAIQAYQKWGATIVPDIQKIDKIGQQPIREIMMEFDWC